MNHRYASEIALRFAGRPIAVICGGPSALRNMHVIDGCAAYISANDHGCRLRPCDYITACDLVHTVEKVDMEQRLRVHGTPIVSPLFYADYRLTDWTYDGNSGMHAIYVAWLLGGHPIIVVGLDCYTGDRSYFHSQGKSSGGHAKDAAHFEDSARRLSDMMPGAVVRLVDSPLTTWPRYDAAELLPDFAPSTELLSKAGHPNIQRIRMRQNACMWKNDLRYSHLYDVTAGEAASLAARGLAEPLATAHSDRR